MEEKYRSLSVEDTEAYAAGLAKKLPHICFIALYGGLGMGKTAFVRGLTSVIAPGWQVTSPTYTVVNCYGGQNALVNHFDLYRITDEDSLESVGFYDTIQKGITVCEWCENIPFALPSRYLKVDFSREGENVREITVTLIGCDNYADLGN